MMLGYRYIKNGGKYMLPSAVAFLIVVAYGWIGIYVDKAIGGDGKVISLLAGSAGLIIAILSIALFCLGVIDEYVSKRKHYHKE